MFMHHVIVYSPHIVVFTLLYRIMWYSHQQKTKTRVYMFWYVTIMKISLHFLRLPPVTNNPSTFNSWDEFSINMLETFSIWQLHTAKDSSFEWISRNVTITSQQQIFQFLVSISSCFSSRIKFGKILPVLPFYCHNFWPNCL